MKKLLTLCVVGLCFGCSSENGVEAPAATMAGMQTTGVQASGEIASRDSAALGPPAITNLWNYTIAYMAPEGMNAKPGMPLLRFETQELQNRLIDKQAELDNKSKELARARIVNEETLADLDLELDRLKSELEKARQKAALPESVLAQKEYKEHQLRHRLAREQLELTRQKRELRELAIETDERLLQGEVDKLQGEVDDLTNSIARMTVTAPREGLVVHLRNWRQEKISVGDQIWNGMRVMELPDLDQLVVKLEVAERDLARVAEGLPLVFTLDASPDIEFTGAIESLGRVVRTKSRNQPAMVIDAVASIENPDRELMRPGMRVNARISAPEAS